MKKKALVLSGGGVKGTLQVEILKELEKKGELKNLNFIIGSSVGAINGSIIASGKISAVNLCQIYPDMIKSIFKKRLIPPIYDRRNFIDIWRRRIGVVKMKDLITPMIITAIDFAGKKTHFFKSWEDKEEDVMNVVLRSFAAPFYFGFLSDCANTGRVYGDGGMGDDNLPITEAILEAVNLDWFNEEEVKFIVIGTGYVDITEKCDVVAKEGFIRQTLDFVKPSDGGFARMVSRTEQLGQLEFICKKFKNVHFDYYDIQIPKSMDKMDAVNLIPQYKEYGLKASIKPLISM
ncbi:MAG: patatin-like phospholipase family protein [Candidatus Woesearchaeota archaeon]